MTVLVPIVLLIADREVVELARRIRQLHAFGIDPDGRTANRTKVQGPLHLRLLALEHGLDAAVWQVPHPTSQPEGVGALLCASAEEHSLHATFEYRMSTDFHGPGMGPGTEKTFPQNDGFSRVINGRIQSTKAFYTHRAI